MSETTAQTLANATRHFVIAPAGYGKTYLIAETVTGHCKERQLLLTHTHAGVRAMKQKMKKMGGDLRHHHVETISGFALRYVLAYPVLSEVPKVYDETGEIDWSRVYQGAARLLAKTALGEVVQISYAGLFVDEYQDCTVNQHSLILRLADLIPCRILGDPLQGIFEFGNNMPVDWDTDVRSDFDELPRLTTPHRWEQGNRSVGKWLQVVREKLEREEPISLDRSGLPPGVRWFCVEAGREAYMAPFNACKSYMNSKQRVAAIYTGTDARRCHDLASKLRGRFQVMEPVESRDLFSWSRRLTNARAGERAVTAVEFAEQCMTAVSTELRLVKEKLRNGKSLKRLRKHPEVVQALRQIRARDSFEAVAVALEAIRRIPGTFLYRKELWFAMLQSLREFEADKHTDLEEAARHIRELTRRVGHKPHSKTVSRTLLIKGLEVDHAIVVDADKLQKRELYVALTRGIQSVTILAREPVLNPR